MTVEVKLHDFCNDCPWFELTYGLYDGWTCSRYRICGLIAKRIKAAEGRDT